MAVKSKIIYNLRPGFKLIRNCGKPILSLTACVLTARQYGEVVLPDASTGQGPGTPRQRGQKAVTVQGGYGTCFCRHGTIFMRAGAIAVQV